MNQENIKQNISLNLHDTSLAIKVYRSEEEYYRKAEKLINSKANTYFSMLSGKKSDKEIMYAIMLDIAVSLQKEAQRNDTAPFNELLGKLTSEIEQALKK